MKIHMNAKDHSKKLETIRVSKIEDGMWIKQNFAGDPKVYEVLAVERSGRGYKIVGVELTDDDSVQPGYLWGCTFAPHSSFKIVPKP